MKRFKSARQIQDEINKFEDEINAKDAALLEKKNFALQHGNNAQADYFQSERDKLAKRREAILLLFQKSLAAAQERESQEAGEKEAKQIQLELDAAHFEAEKKKLALAKWIQAGGAPSEFESAWPMMYSEILQAQTLQKLVKPARTRHLRGF